MFRDRVYAAVQKIPYGKVSTYGIIAEKAGSPRAARAVGNALHKNPDEVNIPCYKVVSADGSLAAGFVFGGKDVQKERLEKEGIEVVDGKVDLKKYLYR